MSSTRTIFVGHLGGIEVGYWLSAQLPDLSKPTVVLFNPFTATAAYHRPEFENKALTSVFNLLAIEPLGHGKTFAKKTKTFTYWDSAIMALQVLSTLCIEQAYVLGTSQGGWIAARMALVAPERVKLAPFCDNIKASADTLSLGSRYRFNRFLAGFRVCQKS